MKDLNPKKSLKDNLTFTLSAFEASLFSVKSYTSNSLIIFLEKCFHENLYFNTQRPGASSNLYILSKDLKHQPQEVITKVSCSGMMGNQKITVTNLQYDNGLNESEIDSASVRIADAFLDTFAFEALLTDKLTKALRYHLRNDAQAGTTYAELFRE